MRINDAERFEICKRCIVESFPDTAGRKAILIRVQKSIELKKMWKNPKYMWTDHIFATSKTDVCPHCPYKLEHTVISQREIHEEGC